MSEQVALNPEKPIEAIKNDKPEAPLSSDREYKQLYELFGVSESERTEQDFKIIWEYAKERAENKDKDSILYEIIRLKNRMKSPDIGEKPYLRVLLYIKEYMKMREAEKKMEELSG